MASTFVAGVGFNSWRQMCGPPVQQSGTARTIGIIAFGVLVVYLLLHALVVMIVRRRRGRGPLRRTLVAAVKD